MATTAGRSRPRRWGRRGLLRGFGAGALGTATVVFGAPDRAAAHYNHVACCHLVLSPSAWSGCAGAGDNYIWSCTQAAPHGTCYRYQCCEAYTPYGSVYRSGWRNAGIC